MKPPTGRLWFDEIVDGGSSAVRPFIKKYIMILCD
jgi:hypothetical protein